MLDFYSFVIRPYLLLLKRFLDKQACNKRNVAYKGEVFSILTEQLRENNLSVKSFFIFKNISVHKAIRHSGVSMDVNIEFQGNFLYRKYIR